MSSTQPPSRQPASSWWPSGATLGVVVTSLAMGALLAWEAKRSSARKVRAAPKVLNSWTELIGNTPMVHLRAVSKATGCRILVCCAENARIPLDSSLTAQAKMESSNPCGSSKDRVALRILQDSCKGGSSSQIARVYEGTSGSTGISLGLIARSLGLGTRVWLPDDTAADKVSLLKKVGADVVQVPNVSIVNPKHYVNLARSSAEADPAAVFADQFETPSNVAVHYDTTGPEIWEQVDGQVDAFIAGAGTGGTLAGVSQYLKEMSSGAVRIALADPPGSSLFHWAKNGVAYTPQQAERSIRRHRYDTIIEGVGLDRVTANMRHALVDDAFQVSDQEAVHMARWLLQEEGLFVGSSSAMNVAGAVKLARTLPPGSTIVTLLCDHGSRHLTRFWNDEYLREHGLDAPRLLQPQEAPTGAEADGTLPHGSVAFVL